MAEYGLRFLLVALVGITWSGGVEIEPQDSLTVSTGEAVHLTCEAADGSTMAWYFNGLALGADGPVTITELTDGTTGARTSFLSIDSAEEANSGRYSCRNPDDYFDSDEVTVNVVAGGAGVQITEPAGGELTVSVGRSFTLKCRGGTDVELVWKHNGMGLTTSSRLIITAARNVEDLTSHSILTRTSITADDQGNYVCADAADPFSKDSVTVSVQDAAVTGDPVDIVTPSGSSMAVVLGESFLLQCEGPEGVDLQWLFGDVTATMFAPRYDINTATSGGKTVSLLSRDTADAEDSGVFTCRNADNEQDQDTITVAVQEPREEGPSDGAVPTEQRTHVMAVGSSMNLQCRFEAPGEHVSEWSKDNTVLASSHKYVINNKVLPSILKIHNTDRTDVGVYRCSFKQAETGEVVGVVVFNVTTVPCPPLVPPVNGSVDSCPEQPVLGDTCTFQCESGFKLAGNVPTVCELGEDAGSPAWSQDVPSCRLMSEKEFTENIPTSLSHVLLRVGGYLKLQCRQGEWSKDGKPLVNGPKYTIEEHSLIIKNTAKSDSGIYNCKIHDIQETVLLGIKKFNVTTLPCPKLSPPVNGSVDKCSTEPVYGETCTFKCETTFKISGSRSRTCELAHTQTQVYWTGNIPFCKNVNGLSSQQRGSAQSHHTYGYSIYLSGAVTTYLLWVL